jgi:hypothetical protein
LAAVLLLPAVFVGTLSGGAEKQAGVEDPPNTGEVTLGGNYEDRGRVGLMMVKRPAAARRDLNFARYGVRRSVDIQLHTPI